MTLPIVLQLSTLWRRIEEGVAQNNARVLEDAITAAARLLEDAGRAANPLDVAVAHAQAEQHYERLRQLMEGVPAELRQAAEVAQGRHTYHRMWEYALNPRNPLDVERATGVALQAVRHLPVFEQIETLTTMYQQALAARHAPAVPGGINFAAYREEEGLPRLAPIIKTLAQVVTDREDPRVRAAWRLVGMHRLIIAAMQTDSDDVISIATQLQHDVVVSAAETRRFHAAIEFFYANRVNMMTTEVAAAMGGQLSVSDAISAFGAITRISQVGMHSALIALSPQLQLSWYSVAATMWNAASMMYMTLIQTAELAFTPQQLAAMSVLAHVEAGKLDQLDLLKTHALKHMGFGDNLVLSALAHDQLYRQVIDSAALDHQRHWELMIAAPDASRTDIVTWLMDYLRYLDQRYSRFIPHVAFKNVPIMPHIAQDSWKTWGRLLATQAQLTPPLTAAPAPLDMETFDYISPLMQYAGVEVLPHEAALLVFVARQLKIEPERLQAHLLGATPDPELATRLHDIPGSANFRQYFREASHVHGLYELGGK